MRDKCRIKQQIPKTQLELACLLPWAQGDMRLSVPSIERLRGSVVPREQSIVGNERDRASFTASPDNQKLLPISLSHCMSM